MDERDPEGTGPTTSLELVIGLDLVLAAWGSIPVFRSQGDEVCGPTIDVGTRFVRTTKMVESARDDVSAGMTTGI